MPNLFQKLKQNFSHNNNNLNITSSTSSINNNNNNNRHQQNKNDKLVVQRKSSLVASNQNLNQQNEIKATSSSSSMVETKQLKNIFSLAKINTNSNSPSKKSNNSSSTDKNSNFVALKKNQNDFGVVIDNSILSEQQNHLYQRSKINKLDEISSDAIFDPDPVQDEAETFNKMTFLDDRSFMVDEPDINNNLDNEVAEINKNTKLNELAKENNCYIVNEIPEGRLSKINSSRASSRSSLGSGSTRTSSNFIEQNSDHHGGDINRFSNFNGRNFVKKKKLPIMSNESSSNDLNSPMSETSSGQKNILLDALLRKFNDSMNLETNNQENEQENKREEENDFNGNQFVLKQTGKHINDEYKRKESELQKKIKRNQFQQQTQRINQQHLINQEEEINEELDSNEGNNQNAAVATTSSSSIADDMFDHCDATSSFDDEPKRIKITRSTGTQMSHVSTGIHGGNFKQKMSASNSKNANSNSVKLPQNFECKYIGKTNCKGLWGIKNIREPVDKLVKQAKRHKSLDDLINVEALVSEKGIYIVHKPSGSLKTASEHNLSTKFLKNKIISAPEKTLKSGLLPISNISYAAQDNLYSKIFSCIVVRETMDDKTLSECYSFLCARNETARRMALAITLAFKEYGKLLQMKDSKPSQTILRLEETDSQCGEPDSFA